VEAINCANYIVNCTPTKALKNITSREAWNKIKPYVSHFHVIGRVAWSHRVLQPHCNEIIVIRDVKLDENILSCEANLEVFPFLAHDPYSTCVPYFLTISVSSSLDDECEDENTPPPIHLPPDDSIELELVPTSSLPRWLRST
jgi:hypothetical protein